ncbi:response regulator [Caldimonas sp. KR1-144]|uniref:response regulator n=1 Tax=Caldimonas sp. KR1-144 TaxID=3400911 RepID=UPI003C0E0D8F
MNEMSPQPMKPGAAAAPNRPDLPFREALVVDANPASRTALSAMLRDLGCAEVVQAQRAQDARRTLEFRRFDVVICEYHFPGEPMSGQDLMDDLRLANLLPLSTVVVMISSEACYANVAEAAEAALDAYLIKPHTEQALLDRLERSRQRKQALKPIIDAVERGEYEPAAQLCEQHCAQRAAHWINAARIGAELWLRLGRAQQAQTMFELILAARALPWARMGIARSEYQAGGVMQARRTLESLIADQPGYADAYDVMGRVLLDQGEPQAALQALRRASSLTPGCVARLLKLGLLAFYHGDRHEAADALQRAAALGMNSKVFDLQGLVMLGTLQFDQGDRRGLLQSMRALSRHVEMQPESPRLRRFLSTLTAYRLLLDRQVGDALRVLREDGRDALEPDFDFEAACNLLGVMARLVAREVRLDDLPERTTVLADRFAASRATCDLLCAAALERADMAPFIRQRYQGIREQAEAAVSNTLAGDPTRAVGSLLEGAQRTLNARLLDLAAHTLDRHRDEVAGAADLQQRIDALNARYRSYGAQVQLAPWRPPGVAAPREADGRRPAAPARGAR